MLDLSNLFYRNKDQPDYVMIAIVCVIVLLLLVIVIASLNKGSNEPFIVPHVKIEDSVTRLTQDIKPTENSVSMLTQDMQLTDENVQEIEGDRIKNIFHLLRQQHKNGKNIENDDKSYLPTLITMISEYLEKYPAADNPLDNLSADFLVNFKKDIAFLIYEPVLYTRIILLLLIFQKEYTDGQRQPAILSKLHKRMSQYLEQYPDKEQKLNELVNEILTPEQKKEFSLEDN